MKRYPESGQGKVALLLITDDVPDASGTDCNATLEDAVRAAGACLEGSPAIHTYVLAVGQPLQSLDPIAAGGGTEAAHLVDGSQEGPIDAIVNALRSIRDEALQSL